MVPLRDTYGIQPTDFDDPNKLGSPREKVERLTNLIAIFENKELDFSGNRASDDDLLGDAYEYLMRNLRPKAAKVRGFTLHPKSAAP